MINNWLKSQISEWIEHALTAVGVLLLAHGVSQSQETGLMATINPTAIAGTLVALANVLWAAYRSGKDNTLLSAFGHSGASILTGVNPAAQAAIAKAAAAVVALLILTSGLAHGQTLTLTPTNTDSLPAPGPGALSTNAPALILPGLTIGGLPSNVVTAANDLLPVIEQLVPYLTNSTLTLTTDGLYDGKHWGGLADLELPMPGSSVSNWLSLGVGGCYADNDWFVFPVSAKVSQVINVPVINEPLYLFAESGWALRLRDEAMGNQTAVGGAFVFKLSQNVSIIADGGRLELTQTGVPGQWFGGVRITFKF
jgi:hypothetical protein